MENLILVKTNETNGYKENLYLLNENLKVTQKELKNFTKKGNNFQIDDNGNLNIIEINWDVMKDNEKIQIYNGNVYPITTYSICGICYKKAHSIYNPKYYITASHKITGLPEIFKEKDDSMKIYNTPEEIWDRIFQVYKKTLKNRMKNTLFTGAGLKPS